MDAVKRQYERVRESCIWKRADYSTRNSPFSMELLELCRIEESLSTVERRVKRMLPAPASKITADGSETSNQLLSIVEEAKRGSRQEFNYTVVAPVDMVSEDMIKEVDDVKRAVQDLQSVVTCLREACDGQSIGNVLDQMEKIAEITNPLFLRKMEIDYTAWVSLSM